MNHSQASSFSANQLISFFIPDNKAIKNWKALHKGQCTCSWPFLLGFYAITKLHICILQVQFIACSQGGLCQCIQKKTQFWTVPAKIFWNGFCLNVVLNVFWVYPEAIYASSSRQLLSHSSLVPMNWKRVIKKRRVVGRRWRRFVVNPISSLKKGGWKSQEGEVVNPWAVSSTDNTVQLWFRERYEYKPEGCWGLGHRREIELDYGCQCCLEFTCRQFESILKWMVTGDILIAPDWLFHHLLPKLHPRHRFR